MADGQIVRFRIGEAFPADDRLARWMTVCAMALNDLILVNRWLLPRLQEEMRSEPHENFYLGQMAAAHLFEAATFLRHADSFEEIQEFVKALDEERQADYQALVAIGKGGKGKFPEQLRHARNRFSHYHKLFEGENEEEERLKQAMEGHAQDEREQGIRRGEIRDIPPPLTGFRATFADDIATEMMLPENTGEEFADFIPKVSNHIAKFAAFAKEAFNAYTETRPAETWEVEIVLVRGRIGRLMERIGWFALWGRIKAWRKKSDSES